MNTDTNPRPARIAIVDDEPNIRLLLEGVLSDEGYACVSTDSVDGLRAIVAADEPVDLILLDVCLPGADGFDWLRSVRGSESPPVIMMSGHGTIDSALKAIRLGAADFLEKPLSGERLLLSIENALERMRLRSENARLRSEAGRELLGVGPAIVRLREEIAKAAPSDATVLITGENGAGKEVVARSIHRGSRRRERSLVFVNCAAIPRDLLESELFGHERGAFSGAVQSRRGRFELADGGTLMLDEIAEMPPELQAKLLRVLEDGIVTRLGAEAGRKVDVRVVAATNRDLRRAIEDGTFREDLYYRLAVVPLHVPALREHREDIPLLVDHFLAQATERHGRGRLRIDGAAVALLEAAHWPGNVRQLRNLVERLVILSDDDEIGPDAVRELLLDPAPDEVRNETASERGGLAAALEIHERELIELALRACEGNVAAAARRLQIDRANLHRKMRRLGIDRP